MSADRPAGRPGSRAVAVIPVAVAALALALTGSGAYGYVAALGGGNGVVGAAPLADLTLHATVAGLAPDVPRRLAITYDNPNGLAVTATRILVTLGDLSATGCAGNTFETVDAVPASGDRLRLEPGTGRLLTGFAGGTVTWVDDENSSNACLGASGLPIDLRVDAVTAG